VTKIEESKQQNDRYKALNDSFEEMTNI